MLLKISVCICTYNPDLKNLQIVLDALKSQTLAKNDWELIIIDNNSSFAFSDKLNVDGIPNVRWISEAKAGLTHARIAAFNAAIAPVIIFADDDNKLKHDYLETGYDLMVKNENIGALGGKAIPIFQTQPFEWIIENSGMIGCRDLGNEVLITDRKFRDSNNRVTNYPDFSPIGTGLVIRKTALSSWIEQLLNSKNRLLLGRQGTSLLSGEDNDIVLTLMNNGWEVGYFPQLYVDHIIPDKRLSFEYAVKMSYSSSYSWIKVLELHHICPWPGIHLWTLPLRKFKAYWATKAYKSPVQYLKWKGSCGMFDALAEI